jgi:K+-transporting ATPase ATPase C chain
MYWFPPGFKLNFMKQHLLPALRLTLTCIVFFCGVYTLVVWLFAQAAPARGTGVPVSVNGRIAGYALEGQSFSRDNYFWGRPSAVAYNAAGSGGSNKGPTNPSYIADLKNRLDSFIVHNPSVQKQEIPSELITASGSGLDPDLSPEGAYVQVARIAKARNLSEEKLKVLISQHVEGPLWGLFGPEKVNVLKLNVDLDKLEGRDPGR